MLDSHVVLRKARKSGVTAPPPAPPTPPPAPPTPPTPTINSAGDAKDFDELRSYMWKNYKFSVRQGLKAQDFDMIRDSVAGIEDLIKEFPQVSAQFSNGLSIGNKESKSNVYAHATAFGDIQLNAKKYSNVKALEQSYARDVASHFHPAGTTARDIATHEFGHVLHSAIMRKAQTLDWNGHGRTLIQEAYNNLKGSTWAQSGGSYKNGSKTVLDMRKDISRYAASSGKSYETIAEAVADYYRNGSNARPLSKELWKILKRELG